MTFRKQRPNVEGYYWYKKNPAYAPTIGWLNKYTSGSGWFVMPFGYDITEDHRLTGEELWGDKIKEP